jgi:hypothetical protein
MGTPGVLSNFRIVDTVLSKEEEKEEERILDKVSPPMHPVAV